MQILDEEDPSVPDVIAHKFYCGKQTTNEAELNKDAEEFYGTSRGNFGQDAPQLTQEQFAKTKITMTYEQAREAAMNQ